jgi:hypothetical protein
LVACRQENKQANARRDESFLGVAGAAVAGGTTSCGGDLSVGPYTSCSFAQNVEQAYDQSAGRSTAVTAYSPATGLNYTIDCTGGSSYVCSGGSTHNASVYFASGPTSYSTPSSTATLPSPPGNLTPCDQNVSADPATSCPFAENVFEAYANDCQSNGEQSNDTVNAYSSVTNQSYNMDGVTDGVTADCTGGNKAFSLSQSKPHRTAEGTVMRPLVTSHAHHLAGRTRRRAGSFKQQTWSRQARAELIGALGLVVGQSERCSPVACRRPQGEGESVQELTLNGSAEIPGVRAQGKGVTKCQS